MAKLTQEQRDTLINRLRKIYEEQHAITMTTRKALAAEYGVSVEAVTKYICNEGLLHQHQWTERERRYIWLHFEKQGYHTLARRYNVTPYAIKQQVTLMRTVDHDVQKPWER